MNDEALILKIKSGKTKYFNDLIQSNKGYWKSFAMSRFPSLPYEEYGDAIQNAHVKIWKNLNKFQEKSSFKTWSSRIVFNEISTFLSKRGRERLREVQIGENEHGESKLADNIFYSECPVVWLEEERLNKKRLLNFIFKKLDKKFSEILILNLQEGLDYSQIAKRLKIPIGTVMSRIHNARKKAQSMISKYKGRFYLDHIV